MVKKRKASGQDISDTTTFSDHKPKSPPLVSSYNEKIRPILDAIDKLRAPQHRSRPASTTTSATSPESNMFQIFSTILKYYDMALHTLLVCIIG